MKKIPKIAIITRTKDRPLLLERTISSVLSQTYYDWEHVIVNDAGDRTCVDELVNKYSEQYASRIKVIHNEHSKGMERASNIGIKNSQSKYAVILDDDDSWHEDFLAKTIEHLESNDVQGVMTHSEYIIEKIEDDTVNIIDRYPFNTAIKSIDLKTVILSKVYPPPVSFVFRRECWEKLGGFDEAFLKSGDVEFYLRFLQKYKIEVIKETLSNYHARPYNQGIQANSTQKDNIYWEQKLLPSLLKKDFRLGLIYFTLNKLKPLFEFLQIKQTLKLLKGEKIAIYGAGIRAKELLPYFKKLNLVGILDNSLEKQGTKIQGTEVFAPEHISELKPDVVFLAVANSSMVKPSVEKLIQKQSLKSNIISLD